MITVAEMGSDARRFDYVEGERVRYYLRQADVTVRDTQRIVMNGEEVDLDTVVPPNSSIVIANNVDHGRPGEHI